MSFEDLEARLKSFFLISAKRPSQAVKHHIRERVRASFVRRNQRGLERFLLFRFLGRQWRTSLGFSLLFVSATWGIFSMSFDPVVSAGKLETYFGPVEIIRGEETFLANNGEDLRVGDIVKVGNRASAKVLLPNQFVSVADSHTTFRITAKDGLFLQRGSIENEVFRGSEVATDRGLIKSDPGAKFTISVSETGETKIRPTKNNVQVFDLRDGNVRLNAGDQLALRSDTILSNTEIPEDLSLSGAQIRAISSKLAIARSKVLTGERKFLEGDKIQANKDFGSARKTFLSIAQIPKTSRELEIARRKNLDVIVLDDVLLSVQQKLKDEFLLSEIKAVSTLLSIIETKSDQLAFEFNPTGVESFDRYVLLRKIVDQGSYEQKKEAQSLLQTYAVNFLRTIQNEGLRIDQITLLNQEIAKLPRNSVAQEFLEQVQVMFAPDMGKILEEKMEWMF